MDKKFKGRQIIMEAQILSILSTGKKIHLDEIVKQIDSANVPADSIYCKTKTDHTIVALQVLIGKGMALRMPFSFYYIKEGK